MAEIFKQPKYCVTRDGQSIKKKNRLINLQDTNFDMRFHLLGVKFQNLSEVGAKLAVYSYLIEYTYLPENLRFDKKKNTQN